MPPHSPEEAFHPRFVEALQKQAHGNICWMCCCLGDTEEIASLITEHGKDVIQLEQAEWRSLPPQAQQELKNTMNAMQPPQSVEEVKATLETTEKAIVRQSIRNCPDHIPA